MNSSIPAPKFPRVLLILLLCGAYFFVSSTNAFGQGSDTASLKSKAQDLVAKGNYVDAYPLLEKLASAEPNDARVHYYFAFTLLAKANTFLDVDVKRQFRAKARKEFERAKELKIDEPNIDGLLDSLPPDGAVSEKGFSNNQLADKFMNEAEAKFASGELDGAFELYQKALGIDPGIYEAALFSGDVMTKKERFDEAEKWFRAAIGIDPFRETAYRYSATPLMEQGKIDEAKMRYIEAYITEPYNRMSTGGMMQWAQATGKQLSHPKIIVPASVDKSCKRKYLSLGRSGCQGG